MKWRTAILLRVSVCLLLIQGCGAGNTSNEQTETVLEKKAGKDTAAAAHVTTSTPLEKSREDKIIDSVLQLPFIIAANKHIDSISGHKKGIAFIVDSSQTEWLIQAGYNGEERFETYHRLYINPASFKIKVYDAVNDEKISVADYLKKNEQ